MKDEIITATEASRAFSDILHRVSYSGESFTIKKGQRLMARIVPVEENVAIEKPAKKMPATIETKAKSDFSPPPPAPSPPREAVVPAPKIPAPAPAPAPKVDNTPYAKPDYYKTVLAEMNKMLSE